MAKSKDKNLEQLIIFLGIGSYNLTKAKKSSKGLFWSFDKEYYYLLNTIKNQPEESSFDSYSELVNYCKDNFPEAHITT